MNALTPPAQNLSAVLWDLDGTLIDSEPAWLEAETAMLARYGLEMSPETQRLMIGSGLWEAAEHFRELGVTMSADDIVAEWVAFAADAIDRGRLDWRPGALDLLASLRAAGVPCALVTMSVRSLADRIAAVLPEGTFGAIVCAAPRRWGCRSSSASRSRIRRPACARPPRPGPSPSA